MTDLSPPVHTADLRAITAAAIKRLLRAMAATADDATLKDCIMQARTDGWITDEECGWMITYWGLKHG